VDNCSEKGPLTLFYIAGGANFEELEKLRIRVISAAGAVVIYANNRIALLTTMYPGNLVENREIITSATADHESARLKQSQYSME
jgi:hypothetical protein